MKQPIVAGSGKKPRRQVKSVSALCTQKYIDYTLRHVWSERFLGGFYVPSINSSHAKVLSPFSESGKYRAILKRLEKNKNVILRRLYSHVDFSDFVNSENKDKTSPLNIVANTLFNGCRMHSRLNDGVDNLFFGHIPQFPNIEVAFLRYPDKKTPADLKQKIDKTYYLYDKETLYLEIIFKSEDKKSKSGLYAPLFLKDDMLKRVLGRQDENIRQQIESASSHLYRLEINKTWAQFTYHDSYFTTRSFLGGIVNLIREHEKSN